MKKTRLIDLFTEDQKTKILSDHSTIKSACSGHAGWVNAIFGVEASEGDDQ